MQIRLAVLALALLWLVASASAQSPEPKQKAPNEAEVILQDSQKAGCGNPERDLSIA